MAVILLLYYVISSMKLKDAPKKQFFYKVNSADEKRWGGVAVDEISYTSF